MSTTTPKPPSTPIPIPSSSNERRRTPPLGRSLSKRSPPRGRRPLLSPASPPSQPSFTPTLNVNRGTARDVFDFTEIGVALEELVKERSESTEAVMEVEVEQRKPLRPIKRYGKGKGRAKLERTGINDLPDELLLRIFGLLPGHHGFRRTPTGWYNPPTRIALVCRRWLLLAREVIYQHVAIHHVGRIPLLHSALSSSSSAAPIRTLCIRIPISSSSAVTSPGVNSLARTSLPRSGSTSSLTEADTIPSPTSTTPQDLLRLIVLAASPHLQRLSISGVAPSALFTSPSPSASTSFAHLRLTQFSSVTHLALVAPSPTSPLTSDSIRGPLLALTGLRDLSIKGYRSSGRPSDKLDLSLPTMTAWGSKMRQLPLRARTLRLRRLKLEDSCFGEEDLVALVAHITPGSLVELIVEEVHHAPREEEEEDGNAGEWVHDERGDLVWRSDRPRLPTTLLLGTVLPLVAGSLRHLKVALYNYPLVTRPHAIPPTSSNRTTTLPAQAQAHHLDPHLHLLTSLESLDLGGTICSPHLLTHLPPTVTRLTLRGCPALPARKVASWLHSLAARKVEWGLGLTPPSSSSGPPIRRKPFISLSRKSPSPPESEAWESLPLLSTLTVHGGSTTGWSDPKESWEVQKACWVAGIVWRGVGQTGASSGPSVVAGGKGVGLLGW